MLGNIYGKTTAILQTFYICCISTWFPTGITQKVYTYIKEKSYKETIAITKKNSFRGKLKLRILLT